MLKPSVVFLVLYPVILFLLVKFIKIDAFFGQVFSVIYILSLLTLAVILTLAKSQKLQVDGEDQLTFISLLGSETIEPGEILRVTVKRRRGKEVVWIRTDAKLYLLMDSYFPYNELLGDIEDIVFRYQIRTNLTADNPDI
jgi:hypothetical protein